MALGMKTNGYVRNTAQLNQAHVTQMAWVKLETIPGNFHPICGFMESPGSAVLDKDLVVLSSGLLDFQVFDGATKTATGSTVFKTGVWYHCAATADGTNIRVFVNGVLEGTTAAGATYTSYGGSGTFFASGHGTRSDTTTRYLDGVMFDVAMWTEALDEAVIRQIAAGVLRPDQVWPGSAGYPSIYWPMKGNGTQIDDAVAWNSRDWGTINGTVWEESSSPPRRKFLISAGAALLPGGSPSISAPFISSTTVLYQPITPVDLTVGFIAATTTLYAFTVEVEVDRRPPFIAADTIVVSPKLAQPIVNVTVPVISGTATEGLVLTSSTGTWTGTPPLTYAYQWRLCDSGGAACADITGATNPSYIVQAADVGGTLRVVVTASDH